MLPGRARIGAEAPGPTGAVGPGEIARTFLRIGVTGFGGPAAHIAMLHRVVVAEKRWLDERRFLHALNFCMLLPGPEATQLATYCGWLLRGVRGGLIAGGLFVLPGFVALLALSAVYVAWGDVPWLAALFAGLKAAVLAVVVEAVVRIGRRALRPRKLVVLSAAAFLALFVFDVPFPVVVAGAAAAGVVGARFLPSMFPVPEGADAAPSGPRPSGRGLAATLAIGLAVWFAPLAALAAAFGPDCVYVEQGLFFSQAAVVTFGGAYSVLSYVAQEAVQSFGWLTPAEMLDALGLAETTPGPLIQVVQFVAFLGAYRDPSPLGPWAGAVLGAVVTTWVTFVPCFVWIFAGAPWVERARGIRPLAAALTAITAAVLGVVLNLAVWFALHVLWRGVREVPVPGGRLLVPEWGTLDAGAAAIAALACVALLRFRVGIGWTLSGAALAGAALRAF